MRLYIAGANHQDPLCRGEVQTWLADIQAKDGEPQGILVEWSEGAMKRIQTERPKLRGLLQPIVADGYDPAVVDCLVDTMGWEADSHLAFLPGRNPFYLDPPERNTALAINADLHSAIFSLRMAGYQGDRKDLPGVLGGIRTECIACAQADLRGFPDRDPAREATWVERVVEQYPVASDGWALVVIGALHASRLDEFTFTCLVESAGYETHLLFCGWEPG